MKVIKRFLKYFLSFLVSKWMRLRGVKLGSGLNAKTPPLVRCYPGSTIEIGDNCKIHNSSRENVAGIMHRTILATISPGAEIQIGRNVGMSGAIMVAMDGIYIEDDVMLGANVKIYDSDFHPMDFNERILDNHAAILKSPVVIRRGAWIGADAILLKGVEIGEYAVVGAGSVVTRSVPGCSVYAGNPAKLIKNLAHPGAL